MTQPLHEVSKAAIRIVGTIFFIFAPLEFIVSLLIQMSKAMNEETWFTRGLQKRMYNSLIRSQASCRHHAISKRDGDGYEIYAENNDSCL